MLDSALEIKAQLDAVRLELAKLELPGKLDLAARLDLNSAVMKLEKAIALLRQRDATSATQAAGC
jgi:ABC-type phosphate transport system auxiliary subunit